MGIIIPDVVAHAAPDLPPIEIATRTLRVESPLIKADIVKAVQKELQKRGFSPGTADGVYGPQTADAVRQFQAQKGLVADGEVGPATFKALKIPVPAFAKKTIPL
jgi:N-acetylmuramoyl-L-alanine amidase